MTRAQRRWHLAIWLALGPLIIAMLVAAWRAGPPGGGV